METPPGMRTDAMATGTQEILMPSPERAAALAAGMQAVEAANILLGFAREGSSSPTMPFGCDNVVAPLAEALKIASEIERDALPAQFSTNQGELEALGQLAAACAKFLEGWA